MPENLQKQRNRKPRVAKRPNGRRPSPSATKNHFGADVHEYSAADLGRLFNLSAALLLSLVKEGFIPPLASEGKTSFGFQSLLMLRTAGALQAAKISATKIVVALANIRAALPPGSLLTTLALRTAEPNAVVREGSNVWNSTAERSELPVANSKTANLPSHVAQPSRTLLIAEEHYARGYALEDSDIAAARAAYLDALNAHSDHIEARINLGRLLHLNGELKQAEEVYRQAKTSSALLSFNLAILLEDLNREEEAVLAYREALAQDPHLHDAHFNLSRLHERATRPQEALRHLLAYRRHVRSTNE